MASKELRLFALLLAFILIPKDSSANLFGFFSRNNEDSHEEDVDYIQKGLDWFLNGVVEKFSHVADDVRSAAGKVTDGVKSTVDGAIYDASEVFGAIVKTFNPTIFPGTNWCGAGDRARGIDDFGVFGTADHCCRAHDNCPETIPAGETRNGLKNDGDYTLSQCDCDQEFYWCLKNSSSLVAKKIGVTFFNILTSRCFKFDYPMKCAKGGLSSQECDHYEQDRTKPKVWQWVDAKNFLSS